MTSMEARRLLRGLFDAAVAAVQPASCVPVHLPAVPGGSLLVIGAGKASAAMAHAVEQHWRGALTGLVLTRHGHAVPCKHIEILEAGHPLPDVAGWRGARRMFELVSNLSRDDLVLGLFSGGGSSLLPSPRAGSSLAEEQELSRSMLASGAPIAELNCVRRHLSSIQGGRLAVACHPARIFTLLISDVPGDRPFDVASGPTVGDPTTCADALQVVRQYGLALPRGALELLQSGEGESVKPDDPRLANSEVRVIASAQTALEAAAEMARRAGVTPVILGDAIEGEAREVGKVMAGIARQVSRHGQPIRPPCVLLSGGETTVTVRGMGTGGRNVEFLLALALALEARSGVYALAADTDGIDGQAEVAGAFVTPDTVARARTRGLDARGMLAANDAHTFFGQLKDTIRTGPTLTNVNDFRAVLVC